MEKCRINVAIAGTGNTEDYLAEKTHQRERPRGSLSPTAALVDSCPFVLLRGHALPDRGEQGFQERRILGSPDRGDLHRVKAAERQRANLGMSD